MVIKISRQNMVIDTNYMPLLQIWLCRRQQKCSMNAVFSTRRCPSSKGFELSYLAIQRTPTIIKKCNKVFVASPIFTSVNELIERILKKLKLRLIFSPYL